MRMYKMSWIFRATLVAAAIFGGSGAANAATAAFDNLGSGIGNGGLSFGLTIAELVPIGVTGTLSSVTLPVAYLAPPEGQAGASFVLSVSSGNPFNTPLDSMSGTFSVQDTAQNAG